MDEEELAQLVKDMAAEGRTESDIDAVVSHYMSMGLKKKEKSTPSLSSDELKTPGTTGGPEGARPVTENLDQKNEVDPLREALYAQSTPMGSIYDLGKSAIGFTKNILPATVNSLRMAGVRTTPYTEKDLNDTKALSHAAGDLFIEKMSKGEYASALSIGDKEAREYIEKQITQPKVFQEQQIKKKVELYKDIQKEKQEFDKFTTGIPKRMDEINSPKDILGYVAYNVGQTIPQVGLSLLTGGAAGYAQELTQIYDQQIEKIAQDKGIAPEEVIKQGLDDPEAGQLSAAFAAVLDRVGVEAIFKNFGKNALKDIIKSGSVWKLAKEIGKKGLKTGAVEGGTEGGQYLIEEAGSSIAAGRKLEEAVGDIKGKEFLENTAAGAAGGLGLGAAGGTVNVAAHAINPHADLIEKATKEVDKTHGEVKTPLLDNLKLKVPEGDLGKPHEKPVTQTNEVTGQNIPENKQEENIPVPAVQEKEKIEPAKLSDVPVNENGTQKLFVYGTLKDEKNRKEVGLPTEVTKAIAPNEEKHDIKSFPEIVHKEGKNLEGDIVEVTPEQLKKAVDSEKENYDLSTLKLADGTHAFVFKLKENAPLTLKSESHAISQSSPETLFRSEQSGTTIPRSERQGVGNSEQGTQVAGENNEQKSQTKEEETVKDVHGIKKALVPEEVVSTEQTEKVKDKEFLEQGKKAIEDGTVSPEEVIHEVNTTPRALQPIEVAALIHHKATIDKELGEILHELSNEKDADKKAILEHEFKVKSQQILDYNYMAVRTAREQSLAFRLRQMMLDSEGNVVHEIERFKATNKGVISEEMEQKFHELDKQLKEANKTILELEAKQTDKNVLQQLKDIAAFEKKRHQKEMTTQRKRTIAAKFDKIKVKVTKGNVNASIIPGITLLPEVWNTAVETIKQAVLAGVDVHTAIQNGLEYLKAQKQEFDEKVLRDYLTPIVEGIHKVEHIEGKLKIPTKLLTTIVESGVNDIGELTQRVHAILKNVNPNITEREVRDAISEYAKKRSVSGDEIAGKLATMKRIGRIISALEDLHNGKLPENINKEGATKISISPKEQKLRDELKAALKVNPEFQGMTLDKLKKNAANSIAEYERRIKEKDFVRAKKEKPLLDKDLESAYIKKAQIRNEYEKEHEKNRLVNRTLGEKALDTIIDVVGLPTGLLSSLDLSALGRQGLYFITHPTSYVRSIGYMVKQMSSQENSDAYMAKIKNSEAWPVIRDSKLYLAGKLSAKEENFANRLLKNAPWIPISERSYAGFLNAMRVSVFMEGIHQLEKHGYTYNSNPEEYKRLAEHINTGTGRPKLGYAEPAANILNKLFFSIRFLTSSFKILASNNRFILDPNTYKNNARGMVNRMILTDQAKFIGLISALLFMSKKKDDWLPDWNPLSSFFGKIRVGHYWYDITAGKGSVARYTTQAALGEHAVYNGKKLTVKDKNSLETLITGSQLHDKTNGEKYQSSSFLRSKLSPSAGLAWDIMNKKHDLSGNKIHALPEHFDKLNDYTKSAVFNLISPIILSEVLQGMARIDKANEIRKEYIKYGLQPPEERHYSELIAPTAASFLGVSVTPAKD